MNASSHEARVQRSPESIRQAPATPAMQPVSKVLDLVANASRAKDPWYWSDRWAD